MPAKPIYLDYNSTTPVDPVVLDHMLPYFNVHFGNASTRQHAYGWEARAAVDLAREQVAGLIGARQTEVIFTSGATESVNLAIRGVYKAYRSKGRHIVTCQTEHPAVLDTCRALVKEGAEVTFLPVDEYGLLDLKELEASIKAETILVALMAANNETGVLHPVEEIAALCSSRGVLFFCDASQAAGKIELHVKKAGIDLLALSAHKFYGPKGVGALYKSSKNPRVNLVSQQTGGHQEQNLRSGTLNVAAIVGMGKAAELAMAVMPDEALRMADLKSRFELAMARELPDFFMNGGLEKRLPGTSNFCTPGVQASQLMAACPELALAAGSACASDLAEPSHVLLAMHHSAAIAASSIRMSLGRFSTAEEVALATSRLLAAYRLLRQ